MQRFVPRALFKMAAPFDIVSVLLGRNGYGRNGYWPKWFSTENVQMTSDAFFFNYAPGLARVLTPKDAIFVCLNFYATVRCKKALSERQLQGMPRSAARRFFEIYRCVGKCCKTFRSAPLMQRTPALWSRVVSVSIMGHFGLTISYRYFVGCFSDQYVGDSKYSGSQGILEDFKQYFK